MQEQLRIAGTDQRFVAVVDVRVVERDGLIEKVRVARRRADDAERKNGLDRQIFHQAVFG